MEVKWTHWAFPAFPLFGALNVYVRPGAIAAILDHESEVTCGGWQNNKTEGT